MKSNVIFKRYHGNLHRAVPANQEPPKGYAISFRPQHEESGQTVVSLDPLKLKPFTRTVPDGLVSSYDRFEFKRGTCEHVHIITDEHAAMLDALDERIAALEAERDELIEEAYRHGRPVRLAEATAWRRPHPAATETNE